MRKTTVVGMVLPVIAELGGGYSLVGHPNGPAIATWHSIEVLEHSTSAPQTDSEEAPHEIRHEAIRKYIDWSWAVMKGELDFTGWNPCEPPQAGG